MAATVAASEARRVEETRELAAQTAAEWIAAQPDAKLIREAGAIKCGKKGTVEVLELQKEYRTKLGKITDGKVLAECCAALRLGIGAAVSLSIASRSRQTFPALARC